MKLHGDDKIGLQSLVSRSLGSS